MALVVLLSPPGVSPSPAAGRDDAAGRVVLSGAEASAPVVPESIDVDLRDLAPAKEWEPGDPIKEIPRRHTSLPAVRDAQRRGGDDPLLALQEAAAPSAPDLDFAAPIVNVAGQGFTGVNPPDTVGDVGPNHYIQVINQSGGSRVTVYNKTGGALAGPFTLSSLGGTGACANGLGDPIVLYDPLADRWLLSEFASSGNHLCVYVSKTADPIVGGWWFYDFTTPTFPDYPKYAVWPDAYYVGTNESSPAVYALDRARMLNGLSATSQRFTAPSLAGFGFQMLTPADLDGATAPPAGAPGLFLRHRDDEVHNAPGTGSDFLEVWQFSVNWAAPASSTFTGPTNIAVAEFDSSLCGLTSFSCIPQPGSSVRLDPLREVVMFRAQYRNRGGFQSLVGNLATDVNGADRAGVRWFELRKTGTGAWGLHMEGTWSPDTTNRWMGSAAVDQDGNLAVGYSVSASTSVFPGLRFAGRLAGDPAGTLAQGETTLIAGSAANASNRWGDYAAMSVDPSDDCTFWFTSMYSPSSQWATRIGSFKFASCGGAPPPPDFTVTAAPSSLTIAQGASGTSTVTVTSLNGFSSAVGLSCSGQPAGVSCGFSPSSVTPPPGGSANSTLTVSVAPSTVAGSYTFQVVGTSGSLTRSATLSLTVTSTGGGGLAVFDSVLRAPKCATVGSSCDSGPSLVLGRDGLGPEPNQPNTVNNSCADGTSGTFHVDESNDRLKVSTLDGTDFAPGKAVRIEATAWAWTTPSADRLDLYYAANANSPAWTFIATLTPTVAGSQVLSATYTLPAGALQAVRAQFRYQGSASACTAGGFNDRDDLVFAVNSTGPPPPPDVTATFDATLRAPRCSAVGKSCDSGASLLLGRDSRGPEPNQPNTINNSCADGTSGTFHSDESNDRLKVSTLDGTAFAAGKTVRIEATVWAWTTPSADRLDLYSAANAGSPTWTFITTLTPAVAGAQVLSANYTLPSGTLQAVRAQFRYQGSASACTAGGFNDRDDLIFAVQ